MIARRAVPNVTTRTRRSWNLAISRHGATRTVTSVRGAHDFNVRFALADFDLPASHRDDACGTGVAFLTGVTGASSAQTSFDYPSSTCLLH